MAISGQGVWNLNIENWHFLLQKKYIHELHFSTVVPSVKWSPCEAAIMGASLAVIPGWVLRWRRVDFLSFSITCYTADDIFRILLKSDKNFHSFKSKHQVLPDTHRVVQLDPSLQVHLRDVVGLDVIWDIVLVGQRLQLTREELLQLDDELAIVQLHQGPPLVAAPLGAREPGGVKRYYQWSGQVSS